MIAKVAFVFALALGCAKAVSVLSHGPLAVAHAPVALAHAPVALAPVGVEPYDPHPQYNFAYGVQDSLTGDVKAQQETRDGDVVHGSYSLIEPDGTKRVVEYTADSLNGFNAVVHKEPLTHPVAVAHAPVTVAHAPVAVAGPLLGHTTTLLH
ncbi:Chitin bind 4 domain containing protein [Asbolus verrucosus]|uniref:Chitin bind 4 domain containing protein n=1 Tax=Asbolus verrucosus TaxID=1661398 RepID=A0A482VQ49_ASBVE|nr:Chitin bind 4 domain containing protein [Asbolus verrucosus]